MRRHHVGALVAIGIVTDRNLVVDLLARGLPAEGQAIGTLAA